MLSDTDMDELICIYCCLLLLTHYTAAQPGHMSTTVVQPVHPSTTPAQTGHMSTAAVQPGHMSSTAVQPGTDITRC
jgi:hypothetical protein